MPGKANKFFADNWFGKTFIKENKNKVKPSANAILDQFLKETVVLNIISFAKIREVMTRENGTTNYRNHHLVINNTIDILKLIFLLVKDGNFEKQLGQKGKTKISNLFMLETAKMAIRILLHKFQMRITGNLNKAP